MRIRKLFLSVMLSGVTLGSAAAQQPISDPASATPAAASRNASRHIGDDALAASGGEVGPVNKYHAVNYNPPTQTLQPEQQYALAPTAMSYQPQSNMGGYGDSCYGSCNSCNGNSCNMACDCDTTPSIWFGAETLLWWAQDRNAPPLLTTSAVGVAPIAGAPGVTTVAGGQEGLSNGLLPGYRLSAGSYFGPEKRVGLSGRVFGIYRASDTITRSGDGSDQSVGLPIFNTLNGAQDAYLVAFNNGLPVSSGTASVKSQLDLVSADSSLRFLVSGARDHRVDLLGGYTYLRLKDSLGVTSTSVDTFTGNLIPDGTVFQTSDLFSAQNTFHGGHLGLQSTVSRRRVSLSTLTRVSFGNMRQTGSISGSTAVGLPPATPTVTPGGIYSQQSNIGAFSRDTFAFIPELGIKGGLSIRKNMQLTAGYTFLYISKVALAGNQVDPNVDLSQAQGGPAGTQPAFNYREGSMWFQGIDLGVNWTF